MALHYLQVAIPLGYFNDCPVSVSFVSFHGADKFLLDTVLDMYTALQEQVSVSSYASPFLDTTGDMETSELLKEKVSFLLEFCHPEHLLSKQNLFCKVSIFDVLDVRFLWFTLSLEMLL